MFDYFVDKVYLYEDKIVVSMWFSEDDRQVITWQDWFSLDGYWTDESPFVKGEAIKFDSFPSGSTNIGSVELFFYKNEFALVYRLRDAAARLFFVFSAYTSAFPFKK